MSIDGAISNTEVHRNYFANLGEIVVMLGSLRAYSTNALGYVRTVGSKVSVLAPLPRSQLELFAQLKENDRRASFEKVKSALLFQQLSAAKRNLVFKASNKTSLENSDEPVHHDFSLGNRIENIELKPRQYLGPPSKQDYRVLITTSHTQEDILEALDYVQECLKVPAFLKNFEPELGAFALKRAAEAGNFQEVYHKISTEPKTFKSVLRQDFYSEALRIYALRVPYLSHRSKSMLNKLYGRANTGISREMAYAYGLAQYAKKFGSEHIGNLPKTMEKMQALMPPVLNRPRAAMKSITQADLVLAFEAMQLCKLPGSEDLSKSIQEVMYNTARNRPLSAALIVDLADQEQDGVEDEEAAPDQQ